MEVRSTILLLLHLILACVFASDLVSGDCGNAPLSYSVSSASLSLVGPTSGVPNSAPTGGTCTGTTTLGNDSGYGSRVASIGDVNHDGMPDLAVASPDSDNVDGTVGAGVVNVYFGAQDYELNLGFTIQGHTTGQHCGSALASVGDFNGDELDDFALTCESAPSGVGIAYLVYGFKGDVPYPNAELKLDALTIDTGVEFTGADVTAGGMTGSDVTGADLNNDNLVDLVIGSSSSDAAYIVWGIGASLDDVSYELTSIAQAPTGIIITATSGLFLFGHAVVTTDLNGDAISDLLVSSPHWGGSASTGAVWVAWGPLGDTSIELTDAALLLQGPTDSPGEAMLGVSLGAGDVNGDGIVDIVASSPTTAYNGANSGSVYVAYGKSSDAWSTTVDVTLTSYDLTRIDGEAGDVDRALYTDPARLPNDLVVADFDGDNHTDIAFGTHATGDVGAVRIAYGRANFGMQQVQHFSALSTGVAGHTLTGMGIHAWSGFSVGAMPSVGGAGMWDLLVGSPNANGANRLAFMGQRCDSKSTGIGPDDGARVAIGHYLDTCYAASFVSTPGGTSFGWRVSSVGDVNGDGLDDFGFGSPKDAAGTVYVVFGEPTRWLQHTNFVLDAFLDGVNGFVVRGKEDGSKCGHSLDSIGDFNGDGINDFGFGCTHKDFAIVGGVPTSTGSAYVLYGRSAWPSAVSLTELNTTDGIEFLGDSGTNDWLGSDITGGSDLNQDGFPDLLIGAMRASSFGDLHGALMFIPGTGANRDETSYTLSSIGTSLLNGKRISLDQGGGQVAHNIELGDVNGDGFDDMIVAAPSATGGAGAVYVLFGRSLGLITSKFPTPTGTGTFGYIIMGPTDVDPERREVRSAEDVELVEENDTGYFGLSLGVVDFDNDGIMDVVATAPLSTRNGYDSGSVYLIFGTEEKGIPALDLTDVEYQYGSDRVFRWDSDSGDVVHADVDPIDSPSEIATGDFNGDGYGDFAWGVFGSDGASGGVYVVYGRPRDTLTEIVQNIENIVDGHQAVFLMGWKTSGMAGWSVSGVDSDLDGVDELIIGSPGSDSAMVVHFQDVAVTIPYAAPPPATGSESGYNGISITVPAPDTYCWTDKAKFQEDWLVCFAGEAEDGEDPNTHRPCTGKTIRAEDDDGGLGKRVNGLGDINGDGIDDFAISDFLKEYIGYPEADTKHGHVYVLFGSTSGAIDNLPIPFADSMLDGSNGFVMSASSAYKLGSCVSTAGDLNGDGISDFVVGASKAWIENGEEPGHWQDNTYGAAFVIYGRTDFPAKIDVDTYITTATGVKFRGEDSPDTLGFDCDGGMDLDNDGRPDVAITAIAEWVENNSNKDQGAVYLIYGRDSNFDEAEYIMSLATLEDTGIGSKFAGLLGYQYWGQNIKMMKDFNGDGISDIAISSYKWSLWWPDVFEEAGLTIVVFGQNGRFHHDETLYSFLANADVDVDDRGVGFYGGNQFFSGMCITGGDYNGDGLSDLAIYAFGDATGGGDAGSVNVIYGSTRLYTEDQRFDARLADAPDPHLGFRLDLQAFDSALYDLRGLDFFLYRDSKLVGTGDFNGDGIDDLTVGALGANSGAGRFYVMWGTSVPPTENVKAVDFPVTKLGMVWESTVSNHFLGFSSNGVGDIDGDGIDDLMVGGHERADGGIAYLLYGCGPLLAAPKVTGCDNEKNITLKPGASFTADADQQETFMFKPTANGGDYNVKVHGARMNTHKCADLLDFSAFTVAVQFDDVETGIKDHGNGRWTLVFFFSDAIVDDDSVSRRERREVESLQTATITFTSLTGSLAERSMIFSEELVRPTPFVDHVDVPDCGKDDWVRIIHRVNDPGIHDEKWNERIKTGDFLLGIDEYGADKFGTDDGRRYYQLLQAAHLFEKQSKLCTKVKFVRMDPAAYVPVLEFEYRKKKHIPDVIDVRASDVVYLGDLGITEPLTRYFLEWSRETRVDQLSGFAGRVFYDYSIDGEWMASPTIIITRFLLYRPQIFEQVFNSDAPPSTWGELVRMARYINATQPNMWGFAHVGSADSTFLNLFSSRLQAEDGRWWDRDEVCSLTKSTKFATAANWFRDLYDEDITPGYDLTEDEARNLFAWGLSSGDVALTDPKEARFEGYAAMIFGFDAYTQGRSSLEVPLDQWDALCGVHNPIWFQTGDIEAETAWTNCRLALKGSSQMATSLVPRGKAGTFSMLDGTGVAMSSRSDRQKHAWEWIQFLSDPSPDTGYMTQLAINTFSLPSRIEALGLEQGVNPGTIGSPFDTDPWKSGLNELRYAVPIQYPDAGSPLTTFLTKGDLAVKNLQKVIKGAITPEEAAEAICSRFDSYVSDYRAPTPYDTNTVLQDNWMIPLLVINSIFIAITLACIPTVFFWRSYAVIYFASWRFCVLMWFGCCLGLIGLYWWIIQPPRDWMCYLRIWFPPLAFSLVFGALTAKTWRINKLFNNKKFKVVRIDNMEVLKVVCVMMVVPIILCAVWTGVGNPEVDYVDVGNEDQSHFKQCSYDHFWIFMGLLYGYCGIILGGNCYMAFRVRNVSFVFNESKEIICAVYSTTILAFICLPLVHAFRDQPQAAQAITVCGAWAAIVFFLVSLFGMKFYTVLSGKGVHFSQVNASGYRQGGDGTPGGSTLPTDYAGPRFGNSTPTTSGSSQVAELQTRDWGGGTEGEAQ